MSDPSAQGARQSSYLVVVAGTHVDGKEAIITSLANSMQCPFIDGDYVHSSSSSIARSQAKRGQDYCAVYGRAWFTRMQRVGLMYDLLLSEGQQAEDPEPRCAAVISCFAIRKPNRDAIRDVMLKQSVRVIFVMLQITRDVLVGRTIGAENPELADRILNEKAEDLRGPSEDERDVLAVDSSGQDIDHLVLSMRELILRQIHSQ